MGKITEEELAMLSPEERAAIADDTNPPSTEEIKAQEEAEAARISQEAGAGAAQRADRRPDMEKTDEAKDAEAALAALEAKEKAEADAKVAADAGIDAKAAEAKAAEEAKAAAEAKAAEEAKEAAEAEEARLAAEKKTKETLAPLQSGPLFTLEAEKKHGTKEEIEAKMAALDTKFEDGEIKLSEYNAQRAEFVEALTEMKMFSTINTQVQKAAAEKAWKDAQVEFFKNNSEYLGERLKNVAFVDAVNRLLATDESKTMTDTEVFEAAKKECDAVFYPNGRTPKADGKKVVDIDTKRVEAEEKKKADEAKALEAAKKLEAEKAAGVKTLAKVPASEANVGVDKYDIIDKLTGDAYEQAVAKMSDAERAIYAART